VASSCHNYEQPSYVSLEPIQIFAIVEFSFTSLRPHRRHSEILNMFNSRWQAEYGGSEPALRPDSAWFDRANCKVRSIAAKRMTAAADHSSGVQYFVHWQGSGGSTWETAEALQADSENGAAVKQFELSMSAHQHHSAALGGSAAQSLSGSAPAAAIANDDDDDDDASDYEDADAVLQDHDDFPLRLAAGESDLLLPLPMGKSLPSGGVISDDNLLKLAIGHSVSSAGVTLSELAELAGCPATMLHSWMFGRGRIDDHSEAELKKWLKKHAAPSWRQRMADVNSTVANSKDKHTRKRLALRKSVGTNYADVVTKGGGVSSDAMVGADVPDAELWLKWAKAGGSTYSPDPSVFDLSPADGGASGAGHLEQYAMVDHATLQALMEGVPDLPEAQRPCPPLQATVEEPAPTDAADTEAVADDSAEEDAEKETPADEQDDSQDADLTARAESADAAGPEMPMPADTPVAEELYAFNHYQRQLLALAAVDAATAKLHTVAPGAVPAGSLPAPAGVDLGDVSAHAIFLSGADANAPTAASAPLVQLLTSVDVPVLVTAAGVRVGGIWLARNLNEQEFEHLAIKALAATKQQSPQSVPGEVVKQLWSAYVACDWGTRDAAVWLGTAPVPPGDSPRVAPTAHALPKALRSSPLASVPPPPAGSAAPPSDSGMPPLDSEVYAQARERTAADLRRRTAEEEAAVEVAQARKAADAAIAAKSAAAAAASTATYHGQSSAQSQAEQSQAAAAEALRLLGAEAVNGLRHRGLQPLVFPSRPDAVALYGLAANGTLALQGNVPLAEARSLGMQMIQHIAAQQAAAQAQPGHLQPVSQATAATSAGQFGHGGAMPMGGGMMQ